MTPKLPLSLWQVDPRLSRNEPLSFDDMSAECTRGRIISSRFSGLYFLPHAASQQRMSMALLNNSIVAHASALAFACTSDGKPHQRRDRDSLDQSDGERPETVAHFGGISSRPGFSSRLSCALAVTTVQA